MAVTMKIAWLHELDAAVGCSEPFLTRSRRLC
jgi:hypothetical protein